MPIIVYIRVSVYVVHYAYTCSCACDYECMHAHKGMRWCVHVCACIDTCICMYILEGR